MPRSRPLPGAGPVRAWNETLSCAAWSCRPSAVGAGNRRPPQATHAPDDQPREHIPLHLRQSPPHHDGAWRNYHPAQLPGGWLPAQTTVDSSQRPVSIASRPPPRARRTFGHGKATHAVCHARTRRPLRSNAVPPVLEQGNRPSPSARAESNSATGSTRSTGVRRTSPSITDEFAPSTPPKARIQTFSAIPTARGRRAHRERHRPSRRALPENKPRHNRHQLLEWPSAYNTTPRKC